MKTLYMYIPCLPETFGNGGYIFLEEDFLEEGSHGISPVPTNHSRRMNGARLQIGPDTAFRRFHSAVAPRCTELLLRGRHEHHLEFEHCSLTFIS